MRLLRDGGIGLTALLVAWFGTSGRAAPEDIVVYSVIGIGGVIVIGLTSGLWLLAGRRAIGIRRAGLVAAIESILPVEHFDASPLARGATMHDGPAAPDSLLVSVAGGRRFHWPDCQLVQGKDVTPERADALLAAGLTPCGHCAP